jgi:plasmid stabilization system protein ParE
MIRVIVTSEAERDIDEIAQTIARDSLDSAIRFYTAVDDTFKLLSSHPLIGTRRTTSNPRLADVRSIGVNQFRNYLVFFLPSEREIRVARVVHGARDLENLLK